MARTPNPTALAIFQLQKRYGWRKAMWLLDFMAAWAIAVRANDWQPIDAEQYAAYWKLSRAKGYNDQAKWRETVPDEPTPNDRVIAARAEYERLTAELGSEPSKADFAAILATR
ncbi:MAG: hypothetical protein WCB04_08135 [Mycobacteriales bacterium]